MTSVIYISSLAFLFAYLQVWRLIHRTKKTYKVKKGDI